MIIKKVNITCNYYIIGNIYINVVVFIKISNNQAEVFSHLSTLQPRKNENYANLIRYFFMPY